jgi:serine/threonine protein kinase
VQEFIDGYNLSQEFSRSGIFNELKIKSLLQDLLPVLDYLHSHKIIHRDIKPQNIMRRQQTGQLILIDFGGAKQTSTNIQSQPGTAIYTPGYAPIEQMMGQCYPASDIYSLAATSVRLLTGCLPTTDKFGNFQDELYDRNNFKWRWREYLQKQRKAIDRELGNILDKMLAVMAVDRYQSAKEVLDDLHAKISVNLQLDPVFIERCQRELTHYIGPMASFILQDTLAKNPRILPQQLVEILSQEIPNPQNVKQFKERLL